MKLSTFTFLSAPIALSLAAFSCSSDGATNADGSAGMTSTAGMPSGMAGMAGMATANAGAGGSTNAGASPVDGGSGPTGGGMGGVPPVTAGASADAGTGPGGSGGEPPMYPGFTLALDENFDTPLNFDDPNSIWAWSDGALDEGQVRYAKEAITFENGTMVITVSEDPIAGNFSHAEEKEVSSKMLRSGEVRTKYNNYRYGRYEVRMKAPTINADAMNNGNYIATLFIFRTPKFESWNEIDIEVTGGAPTELTTNLVHGENQPTWMATFANPASATLPFSSREDFHTYAFEWTSDSVVWYVDDAEVRREDTTNPVGIPSLSAKIMMSIWVFAGGPDSFGGDPSLNVYPFSVTYDYVRFYKWDQETTYPMDVAALPPIDLDGSKNNPNDGVPDLDPVCAPGGCAGADTP